MSPIRALLLQAPLVAAAVLSLLLWRWQPAHRAIWAWTTAGLAAATVSGFLLRLLGTADGTAGRTAGFLLAIPAAAAFGGAAMVSLRRRRLRLPKGWVLDVAVALATGGTAAVVLAEVVLPEVSVTPILLGGAPLGSATWPVVVSVAVAVAVALVLVQLVATGIARDPFSVSLALVAATYPVVLVEQALAVSHGSPWSAAVLLDPVWPTLGIAAVVSVLAWRSQVPPGRPVLPGAPLRAPAAHLGATGTSQPGVLAAGPGPGRSLTAVGAGPRAGCSVTAGCVVLAAVVLVSFARFDGPRPAVVVTGAAVTLVLGLVRLVSSGRTLEHLGRTVADADTDEVSGLLNRRAVTDALDWACRRGPGAVLLIDVDRFRDVNQYLGHRAADDVLRQLAERISVNATELEMAGRLGADEFVLICPTAGVAEAMARARQIRSLAEFPFSVGEDAVRLDISIGVAVWPEHSGPAADPGPAGQVWWAGNTAPADGLLSHAHEARRLARERGTAIERWDPERDLVGARRLALADSLRRSVRQEELQLWYQPKVDTRSGAVVGVEALARWRHEGEMVPPDLFIAMAEEAGLITDLTRSLLEQALAQLAAWDEAGLNLSMAVNLSPRTLLDPALSRRVARMLERYGVEPRRLVLEITETTLMPDQPRVVAAMERLRQLGVRLSIDDYGTGHAALTYLRDFAVDELKLDRSYVAAMVEDERTMAIVRSTVSMGSQLGLDVVAEGVERPDQVDALTACGCHLIQGYLLCPPRPAEELTAWLQARPAPTPATRRPVHR